MKEITSDTCRAETALPRNATDVAITNTTAIVRNVLIGSLRPYLKIIVAITPSTIAPAAAPIATQAPRPVPNDVSAWKNRTLSKPSR